MLNGVEGHCLFSFREAAAAALEALVRQPDCLITKSEKFVNRFRFFGFEKAQSNRRWPGALTGPPGGKVESEPGRTTQAEAERRLRNYIGEGGSPGEFKGKIVY
jgi:hypothetical protein